METPLKYDDDQFNENVQRVKSRQKGWVDEEKGIGEPIPAEYFDKMDTLLAETRKYVVISNPVVCAEEEGTLVLEWHDHEIFCYISTDGIEVAICHNNDDKTRREFPYNDNGIHQVVELLKEHLRL